MTKLLQEGDVINLTAGHRVYAYVPEHFVYSNRKGSFALTHSDVTVGGEFEYLAGKYVVYKTSNDGGGPEGHGSGSYPDGYHVFCERLSDSVRVDFYQTGCFTAMIENIKPAGKAERSKWVELKEVK